MDLGPFDCFMLAHRYTLLNQDAIDSFLPRALREGVSVLAAAPFNTGILATGGIDDARYDYIPAPPEIMDKTRRIEAICQAHGVPLAAAASRVPPGSPGGRLGRGR